MKLTGQQIQRIHNAILAGYSPESLRMMVRVHLNENLYNIVGGTSFSEQVFTLIEWAERQGRVLELVRAAQQANPNNDTLQTLLKDAQTWFVAPAAESTPPLTANPPSYPLPPAQVFLSYSRHDTQAMRHVLNLLQLAGIQVWTDEGLEPGTSGWQSAIENAIRQTPCMVSLLSPAAKSSQWVNIEVSFAQRLQRRVFPVLVAGDDTDAIPLTLFNTQHVDGRSDLAGQVTNMLLPALIRHLGLSQPTPPTEAAQGSEQIAISFDWVPIPAGEFVMGSDKKHDNLASDDETLQHKVTVPAYRILRTPVTVAHFALFIEATGYKTTADEQGSAYVFTGKDWEDVKGTNWERPRGPQSDVKQKATHPVTCVSWHDAQAFCKWASEQTGQVIRLPSEAEWEKAARGSDARIWPWGNERPTAKHCNFNSKLGDTTLVGSYPVGAHGLFDMVGNVWEWTSSLYEPYPYKADDGREDLAASGTRTLRGGSWYYNESDVRCAARSYFSPDVRDNGVGFRVVSPGF